MRIPGIRFKPGRKTKLFILIILVMPLFIIDGLNYFETPDLDSLGDNRIPVLIPKGATLDQIIDSLKVHDLVSDEKVFKFWAVSLGYDRKLKAGMFDVPLNLGYIQLLEYLILARAKEIYVTLLEGWENKDISNAISRKLNVSAVIIDSIIQDRAFINSYGIQQDDLTGYLIPDTYALYWGMKESAIVDYLVTKTLKIFEADSVEQAMKDRGLNRHQILTLASIVEGEAIIDSERPVIASVYYNRLKRGMRLQADPTIQFIIDGPPRRLLERDLKIDSPYNTYRYAGLPPGPINNPGRASIMAALFPASTKYLYFVARGDGGHTFSKTLREHNRAKAEFDKIRRKVRRSKRN